MVSIETWTNLTVFIDPHEEERTSKRPTRPDLVLLTKGDFGQRTIASMQGDPKIIQGVDSDGKAVSIHKAIDKIDGQPTPVWVSLHHISNGPGRHAVRVASIPAWADDEQAENRKACSIFVVAADGIRIGYCGSVGQSKLTKDQVDALANVDVLVFPVDAHDGVARQAFHNFSRSAFAPPWVSS